MLERVLIPLDGSRAAERVLPYVKRLVDRKNSRLTLVQVIPPVPAYEGLDLRQLAELDRRESRAYLNRVARRFDEEGFEVRGRVPEGLPAERIVKAARDTRATLIAMTTHGRKGLSRWTMGSVAEGVIRASKIPVFLIRSSEEVRPEPRRGLLRILFPVEERGLAAEALPSVLELGRLLEAEVSVLHVETSGSFVLGLPGSPAIAASGGADGEAGAIVDRLGSSGLRVREVHARGPVTARILDAAAQADLIVMTTHGRTGLARWLQGSVTEEVLRNSPIPMLVVRASAVRKAAAA